MWSWFHCSLSSLNKSIIEIKIAWAFLFGRKRNIIKGRKEIQRKRIRNPQMEGGKLKNTIECEENYSIKNLR